MDRSRRRIGFNWTEFSETLPSIFVARLTYGLRLAKSANRCMIDLQRCIQISSTISHYFYVFCPDCIQRLRVRQPTALVFRLFFPLCVAKPGIASGNPNASQLQQL